MDFLKTRVRWPLASAVIFALLCIIIVLGGCISPSMQARPPQEIIVRVQAIDPTKVEVSQEKEAIHKSMEIENREGGFSNNTFLVGDKAFMSIWSGLGSMDVKSFWNDLVILKESTDIRHIDVYVNSPGGNAFSGLSLADQIERAIRDGFTITAHASGIIASAAVPVFATCSTRIAGPGTIFMVHETSLWKWPGRETASQIRAQTELMEQLRDRYLSKLAKYTKLSKEEWAEKEGRTTWFSAEQAKQWGLVDKIN